ncbi:hypothetical protein LA345_12635 [Burkholderia vietnamiensis]|uniref:Lipoprotein n=1 Tax=Burkholderia vietnamiensis (strain G4 / LMG 22486) TaxID=269482 RepID=A4JFE7_BURVG|nr:hypothetical protein Bcep1808_1997 [Burkholderia vietnamiensis G4]MCB4344758.1 hypothetical protein [Burkholderia vietnamiensis]
MKKNPLLATTRAPRASGRAQPTAAVAAATCRAAPALAACLAFALLAGCSKKDASKSTAADATSAPAATAPAQTTGWNDDAAAKLIAADQGTKRTYVCTFIFPQLGMQPGTVLPFDRPAIGAKKVSANEESIEATSSDAAKKIMAAATSNGVQLGPCTANVAAEQIDTALPLSSYTLLQSGRQVALLYYGLSKTPLPTADIANAFDPDYQNTRDTFKRSDVVKALDPRYQSQQQQLLAQPYVKLAVSAGLGHYDPATKSFPILNLGVDGNSWISMNDGGGYDVVLSGDNRFTRITVDNEDQARALEAKVSQAGSQLPLNVDVYAKAVDSVSYASRRDVVARVVSLHVADANSQSIADLR